MHKCLLTGNLETLRQKEPVGNFIMKSSLLYYYVTARVSVTLG